MKRRPRLSRTEVRWAEAAFGTIYPAVPSLGFDVGVADMGLEAYLDELRAHVPAFTAFGIRFAVLFVALSPLFVIGRARTLAALPEVDRVRVLSGLAASSFYFARQMVLVLKATGGLLYGGHPAIRARCQNGVAAPLASGTKLVALRRKSDVVAA